MKPDAIVYTSNTGHTKQYAELLGKKNRTSGLRTTVVKLMLTT